MQNHNQKTTDGLTILRESIIAAAAIAIAVGLSGCGTSRTVARHQDPFLSQDAGAATVADNTVPPATGVVTISTLGPDSTTTSAQAAAQQVPTEAGTPSSSIELSARTAQQAITQTNHAGEAGSMPSARLADHVESQSSRPSLTWADYDPFLQDNQSNEAATRNELAIARAEALIEASEQPLEQPQSTRKASAEMSAAVEVSTPVDNEEKPATDTVSPEANERLDVEPQSASETPAQKPTSLHPLLKTHDGQFSWRRLD